MYSRKMVSHCAATASDESVTHTSPTSSGAPAGEPVAISCSPTIIRSASLVLVGSLVMDVQDEERNGRG